jgi:hypothetical protein
MSTAPVITQPGPTTVAAAAERAERAQRAESERLRTLMAGMAAGDITMAAAFAAEFRRQLHRMVRVTVFGFGRRDVLATSDDVDELVFTAALAIFERAGGWKPEGAPPWVWAERAIRAAIAHHVGHATVEFDQDLMEQPELPLVHHDGLDGDAEAVLARLSALDSRAGLWWEAVTRFATRRDRLVYFEFELQKALKDRSPSHTVAAQTGLSPVNVRQIASRVRTRLQDVIARDDRYARLRDLEWFRARPSGFSGLNRLQAGSTAPCKPVAGARHHGPIGPLP